MGKKICIAIAAALALSYSGALAYFFFAHYTAAEALQDKTINEYSCNVTGHGEYGPVWIGWMKASFIAYAILSAIALLALIGAFLPSLRGAAGCCTCCANIFALTCTIGLTVIRFGEAGSECATQAGKPLSGISAAFEQDGIFLKNAVIAIWCLCCFHCCMLGAGLNPQ